MGISHRKMIENCHLAIGKCEKCVIYFLKIDKHVDLPNQNGGKMVIQPSKIRGMVIYPIKNGGT